MSLILGATVLNNTDVFFLKIGFRLMPMMFNIVFIVRLKNSVRILLRTFLNAVI